MSRDVAAADADIFGTDIFFFEFMGYRWLKPRRRRPAIGYPSGLVQFDGDDYYIKFEQHALGDHPR